MKINNNHLKYIFTLIAFLWITLLPAQQYLVDSKILTPNDGLANLQTRSIFQDKQGFIWVSTKYGLNRYDGYQFQLYTKESHGLYYNEFILQTIQADADNLWLLYNHKTKPDTLGDVIRHIDILNTKTDEVTDFATHFGADLPFKINDILLRKVNDAKNRPWIITKNGGIFLFDKQQFIKKFQLKNRLISGLAVDKNDNLYIAAGQELIKVNAKGKIVFKKTLEETLRNVWVDEQGVLWLESISQKNGLPWISLSSISSNQAVKLVYTFKINIESIEGRVGIYRTQEGNWLTLAAERKLLLDNKAQLIFDFTEIIGEVSQIDLFTMFTIADNKETFWFSSSIGIFKINIKKNKFNLLHQYDFSSDCRGITEDEKGNIYFNNKKSYVYNPTLNTVNSISEREVAFLLHYYKNTLYSSDYSLLGLGFSQDLTTKAYKPYVYKKDKKHPFSILETKEKDIFLVGTNMGLVYINRITGSIRDFDKYNKFKALKTHSISAIYKNNQQIWLATNKGIFLMTEKEGVLQHFSEASGDLPFDDIRHLFMDKKGVFWLASVGAGLIRWQPSLLKKERSTYKQFTVNDGLSHNYLYAVYEDAYNNLWISSDNGLMRFDKATNQVQVFRTEDGLPHNEFNFTAHYQAKNGTMYFGGLGGLVAFHPKDFITNKINNTPLQFTGFYVLENGKEALTDKTKVLQQNKEIKLQPSDKLIEFRFALLNFGEHKSHTYAYKIEGYTDSWTYTKENFIRITNLPYGKYTLRIKGKSGSGDWSASELKLVLKVLKPFYLQWWFIVMALASIIGLVFWYNDARIKGLEKDKLKLAEEVKKRTFKIEQDKLIIEQQSKDLQVLDVAKTNFFSNMTHEFRTPLTLILGPVQQLQKHDFPVSIKNNLNFIQNNANQLLALVNQLLELSRLEVGKMPIEYTFCDVVTYTNGLINQIQPLADKKNQTIIYNKYQSEWEIPLDQTKWDRIVLNLLSNAIKFTPEQGQIEITIQEIIPTNDLSTLELKVNNTGVGIAAADLPHIFDRFRQVDGSNTRLQEGTGIGLALVKELVELQEGTIEAESTIEHGTTFTVTIPIPNVQEDTQDDDFIIHELIKTEFHFPMILDGKEQLTILIIEDNAEMRMYIKSCIDETIFKIIEAENGAAGVTSAIENVPDLIISDVMMPIKDGFAVTKELRSNAITSHIPIILLTAKTNVESRLEGLRRGADVYLTKPFNADELVIRIYKLVELRQLLQKRYINQTTFFKNDIFEQEDEFILGFKTYILAHLDHENIDSEALEQQFGMSRMQLHRKVKALTNLAPGVFIRNIRLEVALNLLKEKKLTVSEVAYQTGFSSLSHFSRMFKKHYNQSPSDFL